MCVLLNDHVGLAFGEMEKLINYNMVLHIFGGQKRTMWIPRPGTAPPNRSGTAPNRVQAAGALKFVK